MRKLVITLALLLAVVVSVPVSTSAMTDAEIWAYIAQLQAQMLANNANAGSSEADPNGGSSDCLALASTNLRYQARDASTNNEVSALQDFLNNKSYLRSQPTGYFGLGTVAAVKSFQRANGLSQTGYVGPLTRAKINAQSCAPGGDVQTSVTNSTSPVINEFRISHPLTSMVTSTSLVWSTSNVSDCTISGPNFQTNTPEGAQGSVSTGTISADSLYILTCKNIFSNQTVSKSLLVSVASQPIIDQYGLGVTQAKVGEEISIYGKNLLDTSIVTFAGGAVSPSVRTFAGDRIIASVPAGAQYGQVKVCNGTLCASTQQSFTLRTDTPVTATVKVLSPNGGEIWNTGYSYTVSYTTSGVTIGPDNPVLIYLEKGYDYPSTKTGVNSSTLIGTTVNALTYTFTLDPSLASWPGLGANYKVKVCVSYDCSVSDTSDNYITLQSRPITYQNIQASIRSQTIDTTPLGQINLVVAGVGYDGAPAKVSDGYHVQAYVYPRGVHGQYLLPNPAGSYNATYNATLGGWVVDMKTPSDAGNYDLQLSLYCSQGGSYCDKIENTSQVSNGDDITIPFTIVSSVTINHSQDSVTITSPVGGVASWKRNTEGKWTWSSTGSVNGVDIYLINASNQQFVFARNYPNYGNFSWAVGFSQTEWNMTEMPNGNYTITVCPAGQSIGVTCGTFPITVYGTTPAITLTTQRGGEVYHVGGQIPIGFTGQQAGEQYQVNLLYPAMVSSTVYPLALFTATSNGIYSNTFTIPQNTPPSNAYTLEVVQMTNQGSCTNVCAHTESPLFSIVRN